MPNDFFTPSGVPVQGGALVSPNVRAEFAAIAAGFDKLPDLTGNAYKVTYVNSSGSAMDAVGGDGLLKLSTTGTPSIAVAGTDYISATTIAASSAATPNDADLLPVIDGATAKKLSLANLKTFLANVFLALAGGTMTGKLIFKAGTNNIASAATVDLTAATSNTAHITGTTGVGAFTMTSGQIIDVVFDGVLTLTHHATNNNLPGGAPITTAAGDRARYWYDGTTVWCVAYQRANGASVVGGTGGGIAGGIYMATNFGGL